MTRHTAAGVCRAILTTFTLGVCLAATAWAEPPRCLPADKLPDDARLGAPKTLDDYFPFTPPETAEAWGKRAQFVRQQILVATGLWPMPTKTPARAIIHGLVDRGQYTVERVALQSFPGHFVTGSLYRPKGHRGRLPGVLSPHGHFANGRFYDAGAQEVARQIESGAERFADGGRSPLQARCVQLARMGCVVFLYDMVGYADSVQLAHRPCFREAMNTPENWGYFSPQAELRMQNMMGLQTYNSIRVLDWFSELPDVDPQRIGVTGESGGGTQTMILSAIDTRPAVAVPAVMVSTSMQGGCTCENACYLRVDTGNIEFAALTAPRPLGLTAADDWTKQLDTKGLPEIKEIYRLLGVEDRVMSISLLKYPHNYNYPSRAAMYGWMNQRLKLGLDEPIVEEDYRPLSIAEMTVWDAQHAKPPAGDDYERSLLRWITADAEKQMAALTPKDAATLAAWRRVVGGAVEVMIGHGLPKPETMEATAGEATDAEDWTQQTFLVRNKSGHTELPIVRLMPKKAGGQTVIWLDKIGKAGLWGEDRKLRGAVRKLLAGGATVVGVDLLGQGEFTLHGEPWTKNRTIGQPQGVPGAYAGYTYGYNHPLLSSRVQDILTVVAWTASGRDAPKTIDLVGLRDMGRLAAAARAVGGAAIGRAAIDTAGFRFVSLTALDDADFLPGAVKYQDLPGMLALSAPLPLWLAGEGTQLPPLVAAAYEAAEASRQVSLCGATDAEAKEMAAVEWLLEKRPPEKKAD